MFHTLVFVCGRLCASDCKKLCVLCVTLTRLERRPCLSSSSSSCVTSTQRLQSELKGSGLPVSLPSHSTRTPLMEQPARTPLHFLTSLPPSLASAPTLSYRQTRIRAHCPSCILINVLTINSSRQRPGWLTDWLAARVLTKPRLCACSALQTQEQRRRQTLASSHSQSALHMSHVNDIKSVATHRPRHT